MSQKITKNALQKSVDPGDPPDSHGAAMAKKWRKIPGATSRRLDFGVETSRLVLEAQVDHSPRLPPRDPRRMTWVIVV